MHKFKFQASLAAMIFLLLTINLYISSSLADSNAPELAPYISEEFNSVVPKLATNSGAANYPIPIEIPPGRAGMAPKLELSYNSQGKNGVIGVGWNIGIGFIQRSTKRLNYNAHDFQVRSAGSVAELVSRSAWGQSYYGLKIESDFSKYHYLGETGGWEVKTRDGKIYTYGQTAQARQENSNGVFKWLLEKVQDSNGNYIEYSYLPQEQGQTYIDRIDYTGNTNLSPTNSILFFYEGRSDQSHRYDTHSRVVTAWRLSRIEVYGNGALARQYELDYEYSLRTGRSLLDKVTQIGSDGLSVGLTIIPSWQKDDQSPLFANDMTSNDDLTNWQFEINDWGSGLISVVDKVLPFDFNGDGKKDILIHKIGLSQQYGDLGVFESDGSGGFYMPSWFDGSIAGHRPTNEGDYYEKRDIFVPFDYNGDGKSDLLIYRENSVFIAQARNNGQGFDQALDSTTLAGDDLTGAAIFSFDYNGDGCTDLFIYRPKGGDARVVDGKDFSSPVQTFSTSIGGFNISPSNALDTVRILPLDYNGDGLSDLCLYKDGALGVAKSDGSGNFTVTETFGSVSQISGAIFSSWDSIFPFDYNGDGLSDLFIFKPSSYSSEKFLIIARSNGDGSFSVVHNSLTLSSYNLIDNYLFKAFPLDHNGDGLSDLFIYGYGQNGTGTTKSLVLNLTEMQPLKLLMHQAQ